MKPKVHLLARAVITDAQYFLLAHFHSATHTFLPGGHVEPGEGLVACLAREICEELGVGSQIGPYLGAVEHLWHDAVGAHYEINHCFAVTSPQLTRTAQVTSCEPALEFLWVHASEFARYNLLPAPLRALLTHWHTGSAGVWWASTLIRARISMGSSG